MLFKKKYKTTKIFERHLIFIYHIITDIILFSYKKSLFTIAHEDVADMVALSTAVT